MIQCSFTLVLSQWYSHRTNVCLRRAWWGVENNPLEYGVRSKTVQGRIEPKGQNKQL